MSGHSMLTALALGLCSVLAACADVRGEPAALTPVNGAAAGQITIAHDVEIDTVNGYDRKLRQDTVWLAAGNVAQGVVYKPRDTVFTLEGTNVHEAYLVLSGSKLVGYYLPAEHSYVAQPQPVDVPTK
jgi:hypothetical protein